MYDPLDDDSRWLDQVERIVSQFDSELQTSSNTQAPPKIEDCLTKIEEPARAGLLRSLLRVEREVLANRGDAPTADQYAARFPDYTTVVSEVFQETMLLVPGDIDESDAGAQDFLPSRVLISRRVDRYQIEGKLGQGGFGAVYLAHDPKLERHVALKVLWREGLTSSSEIDDYLQEARTLASLRHPGVVKVLDAERSKVGDGYVAMEYVEGRSLAEELLDGEAPIQRTVDIVATVADAIQHVHERGLIHRDLKPANILLDEKNRPVVVDFGLAKQLSADDRIATTGDIIGTPNYMSPEQAGGNSASVDTRSDIYSLGTIMYRMLAGTVPFDGKEMPLLDQVRTRDPTPLRRINPKIPRDLETICQHAMHKDPNRRFQTAGELAEDLRRFSQGLPIKSRPITTLKRCTKWIQRHKPLAGVGTLAMIAIVGFIFSGLIAKGLQQEKGKLEGELEEIQNPRVLVSITTEPPGASVTFTPRDAVTYLPLEDAELRPPGTTPIADFLLPPGWYRVTVVKPDHGSHVVERYVPESATEGSNALYPHLRWQSHEDGSFKLCKVIILADAEVKEGMVPIPGGSFMVGCQVDSLEGEDDPLSPHRQKVPDLFIDPHEVTWGDWKAVFGSVPEALEERVARMGDKAPCSFVTYNGALSYAERVGKRLPTEFELLWVATNGGESRFPWGAKPDHVDDWPLDVVGRPEFDQTYRWDRPVHNLFSNVGEWTVTRPYPYAALAPEQMNDDNDPHGYRNKRLAKEYIEKYSRGSVIFGAPRLLLQNSPGPIQWQKGPLCTRTGEPITSRNRAIGFRCVKSLP